MYIFQLYVRLKKITQKFSARDGEFPKFASYSPLNWQIIDFRPGFGAKHHGQTIADVAQAIPQECRNGQTHAPFNAPATISDADADP